MSNNLIPFKKINWENPDKGVKQKIYYQGNKRLRLLTFKDSYIEEDWCTKNHIGYVLSGKMKIDFNGDIKFYKKGDGLWINAGESNKHKVIIDKGKQVTLILFESV